MTLHPIPLNFLIYEENFLFFFISVVFALPMYLLYIIYLFFSRDALWNMDLSSNQISGVCVDCWKCVLQHQCSLKVMLSRCSIYVSFSLVLLVGQVDSGPPANQLLKLVIQEARYRRSRGKRQAWRWYPTPLIPTRPHTYCV